MVGTIATAFGFLVTMYPPMSKLKMNIGKAKYENSRLDFFEFLHLFVMCTVMDAPTTPINPKKVIHRPKSLLNIRPKNRVNGMVRAMVRV